MLYADHYIINIQAAEDIVQEFLMRLWEDKYLGKVTDTTLKSYLFVSVRNACYTYCHKKDFLRDSLGITEIDVMENTVTGLNQQIVNRVTSVIERLPRQTRLVLESILMNDKKYKEVSEELHVSVNTVKTLLKGGMRTLRDEFKDEEDLLLLFFLKKC